MRLDTHERMAYVIFKEFGEIYGWDFVRMDRCQENLYSYFGGAAWGRAWEAELSTQEKRIYREWMRLAAKGDEDAQLNLQGFERAVQEEVEQLFVETMYSPAGRQKL